VGRQELEVRKFREQPSGFRSNARTSAHRAPSSYLRARFAVHPATRGRHDGSRGAAPQRAARRAAPQRDDAQGARCGPAQPRARRPPAQTEALRRVPQPLRACLAARAATGCLSIDATWRSALFRLDTRPRRAQAPPKWAPLHGDSSTAAAGPHGASLSRLLEAFPGGKRGADDVVKVLAVSDYSEQRAAETLLDPAATRAALSEWGQADRRGRTPSRLRPRPGAPEAAPTQPRREAATTRALRPGLEVYRNGEAAPSGLQATPSRFTDHPSQEGPPEFARMMRVSRAIELSTGLPAAPPPPPPGQFQYASALEGLTSLEQSLALIAQEKEAAAARCAWLAAEEQRVSEQRAAMLAAQALEGAMHAEVSLARAADAGAAAADRALAAARAAIGARCGALRAAVDARQAALERSAAEAHAASLRSVSAAVASAARAKETLRAARASPTPVNDEPLRAATAALSDAALRARALDGAPPFSVAFGPADDAAPAQLAAMLAAFGAVAVSPELEAATAPVQVVDITAPLETKPAPAKPARRLTAAAVVAAGLAKKAPPLPRGGFSADGFIKTPAPPGPVDDDAPAPRDDDHAAFPPLPGRAPPPRPRAGSSSPPSGASAEATDASSEASGTESDTPLF
jgi:hypothetical protein